MEVDWELRWSHWVNPGCFPGAPHLRLAATGCTVSLYLTSSIFKFEIVSMACAAAASGLDKSPV